jgi:tryptophan 2,3-dioxygenase
MLARLSPWEYQEIRKVLGHESGLDSPGFVEIKRVTPLLGQAFSNAVRSAGASLEDVYGDAPRHPQLYDLAESMVGSDESLRVWRYRYLTVAECIIGNVVGT